MKHKPIRKALALLLCLALLVGCFPLTVFAESADATVAMTEGDVIADFVPAGTSCTTTDASVAWVDENGSLNALKPGTVTVSDGETAYTVTVSDYTDGSEVVGNLKLLARFNDSMQFYDGHVYLLFTSYQDGVEIRVDDLYAGYEISDQYYQDIREDIANGSNHSGNSTDPYFTFSKEMKSVSLDRGELVTIGMYRDFDMSVPQAALGSIKNSSAWTSIVAAGKTSVIEAIFQLFNTGRISSDEAVARLKAVLEEIGVDYNKALDGVVEGGVCFNRELYNQKLEWDQYENVTYDMDITKNQLDILTAYLGGNLNKFSILKNSCATVALRAWNAAVGTRNGEDTAYKLSSSGSGILSVIDAPKGVRQSMVNRLPGYYLNNAEGVAEPGAGYQDDTGWVYVSAPKAVAPVTYTYTDASLRVDESKTKLSKLINQAKGDTPVAYDKDAQDIGVTVLADRDGEITTINGIDFAINGSTVSINRDNVPEEGIWFTTPVATDEDVDYYVTDAEGNVLPSTYADGSVSFCAEALPLSFKVVGSSEGAQNLLRTVIVNGDNADTEIYRYDNDVKVSFDTTETVSAGTVFYVKSALKADAMDEVLADVRLNGESYMDSSCYDEAQAAYRLEMPASYANLTIIYEKAIMEATTDNIIQIPVGEELDVQDLAMLHIGEDDAYHGEITCKILSDEDAVFSQSNTILKAEKEGTAMIWVCAEGNSNIGVPYVVEVYSDAAEMVKVSFSDTVRDNLILTIDADSDRPRNIPFSGYLIKKGSSLSVTPNQSQSKAILYLMDQKGNTIEPNQSIIIEEDTTIRAGFTDAIVSGMPNTVKLDSKGDTYQLQAQVQYAGILRFIPVYDKSVRYTSSDALVTVDENGVLTVADDVPENGKVVYITAYAGSSNDKVFAACRVVIGNYQGDRIVGRLTISARPIVKAQLVAHGAITFTTYEDTNLNVSYYNYYKPNQKYIDLSHDYDAHPEKYTFDPVLYHDNELGIDDRESYFDAYHNGSGTPAQTLSLKKGEGITLSNYGYETANLDNIIKALQDSSLSSSKEAQELIRQINNYSAGQDFDGVSAFDSFAATIAQIIQISRATGHNPADGHSEGGLDINREVYNQFRRSDSQLPNNYYTVEITADEFAMMEQFVANPDNNYYSLMAKNCATGSVDIWNATLADKPELRLTGNYTGIAVEPESLYVELGLLGAKQDLDGEGGKDFYPRIVPPCTEAYILGDADGDGVVTIADVTTIQRVIAEIEVTTYHEKAADVNGDGSVTIDDATQIQSYLAEMPVDYPIGQLIAE